MKKHNKVEYPLPPARKEPSREPQLALSLTGEGTRVRVKASPFIKWAGGKGRLLPQMAPFFPPSDRYVRYFEPFLGGGAVFFFLQPASAFLSDLNEELINAFKVVRDDVEELILSLYKHRNEAEYYYRVRALDPHHLDPVERASRFIYLNKTCYNGLYRVNRKGQFNVPFGRYREPRIVDPEGLRAASLALQGTRLWVSDFAAALAKVGAGDFVYLDPPYHPLSPTASFTSYTSTDFGESDQRRLSELYKELDHRGALLMLSNSDTSLIHRLYDGFLFIKIQARRAISCRADRRGPITELLILNYEPAL